MKKDGLERRVEKMVVWGDCPQGCSGRIGRVSGEQSYPGGPFVYSLKCEECGMEVEFIPTRVEVKMEGYDKVVEVDLDYK